MYHAINPIPQLVGTLVNCGGILEICHYSYAVSFWQSENVLLIQHNRL